jgi:hypothetical protein
MLYDLIMENETSELSQSMFSICEAVEYRTGDIQRLVPTLLA